MTSIPSPREILNSILTSLSSYNPADHQPPSNQHQRHSYYHHHNQQPPNPLKLIPNSHRALLSTLHVLYPSTLLPALDLLDRQLVTRVVVTTTNTTATAGPYAAGHSSSSTHQTHSTTAEQHQPRRTFHLVRSAQGQSSTTRRRHHNHATTMDNPSISSVLHDNTATTASSTGGPGGRVYVVRLDAWNCSCAAFAFSAFPSEGSLFAQPRRREQSPPSGVDVDVKAAEDHDEDNTDDHGPHLEDGDHTDNTRKAKKSGYDILPAKAHDDRMTDDDDEDLGRALECGGLSIDGLPDSGISSVPCCKHLLACLLGERWSAVLGAFVQERVVSREEGAGLMPDV